MQTKRFASKSITSSYPLPCLDTLKWERSSKGFRTSITLHHLEAGQLLIPCLSIPYTMTRFSAQLTDCNRDKRRNWLISPGLAGQALQDEHESVTTHIDYFHIHQSLNKAVLVLEMYCSVEPVEFLLVLTCTQDAWKPCESKKTPQYLKTQLNLPQHSQMNENEAIRDRICSPICLQMLLEFYGLLDDKLRLIADCFDSSADLYGVWPINIAAASKRGLIGAIESFNDFELVCTLLEKNIPLVCSIRFNPGQLNNAPLDETSGHLVILAGVDEHSVRVYDPAASSTETVVRNYARNEFQNAWIDNNGIAYVLVPCEPETTNSACNIK